MLATIVFGLFLLAGGERARMFKAGSSSAMYHCTYQTTIRPVSSFPFCYRFIVPLMVSRSLTTPSPSSLQRLPCLLPLPMTLSFMRLHMWSPSLGIHLYTAILLPIRFGVRVVFVPA
ncbi:hypothetical protein EDC04DRAFT_2719983 [Pisolithus marmoratus]|nr:hypothetical protein EDC04DRAFT_2719983 [Pisolithus marmoratus]